jgi:hypothetical protein
MKYLEKLAMVLALVSVVPACTTIGTGSGEVTGAQQESVTFMWKSTDGGMSGAMTASLPQETFQGRFFQITQQTRGEVLAPLWTHWRRGWYDWPYWSGPWPPGYSTTQFITHYSGKVVATLESPSGQRMRCRFHLVAPASGMAGGGEGECQLSDGRRVRAVFAEK